MLGVNWGYGGLMAALVLAAQAIASTAGAATCFPNATGVPGLPGAPQWLAGGQVRPELNDPRWLGSLRQSYPRLDPVAAPGASAQATIRGLVQDSTLFLSYQALLDPSGTGAAQQDAIYLALAQNADAPAKMIRFKLSSSTNGPAQTGAAAIEYWEAPNATAVWAPTPPNASTGAMSGDVAVWVANNPPPGTGGSWALNLKVDLAALGFSAPFLMWSGIVVDALQLPPLHVYFAYPMGEFGPFAPSVTDGPPPTLPYPVLANEWDTVTLGTEDAPCTGGVSLSETQVGIDSGTGALDGALEANAANTWVARPTYSGVSAEAGKVQASVRFARDLGGATVWDEFPGTTSLSSAQDGSIQWECLGEGPLSCAELSVSPTPLCVLVELSAQQAVRFSRSGTLRCVEWLTPDTGIPGGSDQGGNSGADGGDSSSGAVNAGDSGNGGAVSAGDSGNGGVGGSVKAPAEPFRDDRDGGESDGCACALTGSGASGTAAALGTVLVAGLLLRRRTGARSGR